MVAGEEIVDMMAIHSSVGNGPVREGMLILLVMYV